MIERLTSNYERNDGLIERMREFIERRHYRKPCLERSPSKYERIQVDIERESIVIERLTSNYERNDGLIERMREFIERRHYRKPCLERSPSKYERIQVDIERESIVIERLTSNYERNDGLIERIQTHIERISSPLEQKSHNKTTSLKAFIIKIL